MSAVTESRMLRSRLQLREPRRGRSPPLAEQPLEDRARVGLHRQRHRRRPPRERVDVDAAVAPFAVADDEVRLQRELERASGVSLPSSLRRELVDGRARPGCRRLRCASARTPFSQQPLAARVRAAADVERIRLRRWRAR